MPDLVDLILATTAARGSDRTICPSEVARRAAGDGDRRSPMPAVRAAAAELATDGRLRVTRRGRPVDPCAAHRPIHLGRAERDRTRG